VLLVTSVKLKMRL